MLMTAMGAHMHKVSLYMKATIHLCVQNPDLNVYFNNVGIFVFEVMEESHQRSRIFMARCRALQQDLQTVSSPHHTAPLVVSYYSFVALWPRGPRRILR